MVSIEYANAYSEVLEILNYISKEDLNKIPDEKIKVFERNKNSNYIFKYDPSKTLDEQNVSKIAKGIIGIIYRDYWATEEQKEKIFRKQTYERQKIEKEKANKYQYENLFKKNINEIKEDTTDKTALVVYKKNVFQKFFEKIRFFLK